MFSRSRQTFLKYVSWLCSRFDFPASSWTWGNLTLKKNLKKKAVYLQGMCIMLTFLQPRPTLCLTWCGWCGFHNESPGSMMSTLTSQWETQTTNFLTVCKSWAHKERQRGQQATAPCSGTQNPRGLCCWSTQKQPPEWKRRKILCAQGVNCRYSVPS